MMIIEKNNKIYKTMYDIIYLTNLPSFYKINLFNRIAERKKILVVFTHEKSNQRNEDFYKGHRAFEYQSVSRMSYINKYIFIYKLIKKSDFKHLIVSGWDQIIFFIAVLLSPKSKNCVVIESSVFESNTSGLKGFIKRLFLKRITKAYVSGKSQEDLCKSLGFKGDIIKTRGVGIFNIIKQPRYLEKSIVTNFLYVGRLSHEKNLKFLIKTFNQLPQLTLNIVGFGPQDQMLKSISNKNIKYYGEVANKDLYKIYQQNDVFILPSFSEPWGMVVEEALNNGLPVIVSDRVGCAQEIVNENNGVVFKISEYQSFIEAVNKMQDVNYYNSLRLYISQMDFERVADEQVGCYL